jgi:hypothetical protein
MASFHWQIGLDSVGTGAWSFEVNPLDVAGMFPDRAYNRLPVLSGSPLKQFPQVDTRIRTISFDIIPGTNTTHRDFLLGTDEDDTTSLLYLKKLDSDGQLTIYWLNIPDDYQRLRPYGYRDEDWIPIRVLDVRTPTEAQGGTPRWKSEMVFEIVPPDETDMEFTLGESALGGDNELITEALDAVYTFDATGPTYTDRTTVSYTGGTPFPSFVVVANDLLYFGAAFPFQGIWVDVDTAETVVPDTNQGKTANAWTYWNGSAWTAFTAVDGTEHFTKDERAITWSSLSGWTTAVLSSAVAGAPTTTAYFWVRVTVGTVTTAWKLDKTWRN